MSSVDLLLFKRAVDEVSVRYIRTVCLIVFSALTLGPHLYLGEKQTSVIAEEKLAGYQCVFALTDQVSKDPARNRFKKQS